MNADEKSLNAPVSPRTAPMPSGNCLPSDYAKADATKPDRQSRSLVKDLPVGRLRSANGKQYD